MNSLASVLIVAAGSLTVTAQAVPVTPAMKPLPSGQFHFQESCGGCHGLLGASAREQVPELRGVVGNFLCTEEGRRYIVQLPNVAFANMDDRGLADTMNFVAFSLGAESVPPGARSFTAAEVGKLRRQPLKNKPLARIRNEILGRAINQCQILRGGAKAG